ncbi:TonB-dependent receptor [Alteromonas sp. 14N.309.X.WAT.G.H12]|uniref:TonB-dependent receptor n=1 Tax=Alteromonas sp. 14N.309.X.WAT.G.H12 TaxID=3120824 RepID=UPI002FD58924
MHILNKKLLAISVACALGISAPVFAGNNDGGIRLTVVDTTSAPLVGATIVLKNKETGYTKEITADEEGNLRISSLPIGEYSIHASKSGYEDAELATVSVQLGQETKLNVVLQQSGYEHIEVTGVRVSAFDVTSSESALNINASELARLPVARNIDSVTLLAPGTTQGDDRFGGTSFGGSSVAENQMYINGLNVTNFRNGLGFSSVPYDFYDQFQIKTGGYSAEFGRSTGGVINAVTKSGTNEFKMGANVYWSPASLRAHSPNVASNNGDYFKTYNSGDNTSEFNGNIYASGPIIEDKLFFYAIYSPTSETDDYQSRSTSNYDYDVSSDNDFWGVKLDWNISEDHRLEFLAFSDEQTEYTDTYAVEDDERTYASTAYDKSGGKNWSIKYTGYLTDDFTVTALYGQNEYDITSGSNVSDDCELILDYRYYYYEIYDVDYNGYSVGCATTSDYYVEDGHDERDAYRLDAEWYVNDKHLLRFGLDREENTSENNTHYSGDGSYWLVYSAEAGSTINGVLLTENTDYIRSRYYNSGGNFKTIANAFYIEDQWSITDTITATIGLRNEQFDNRNAAGDTFIKIDDMIAPRLGISWDINGDGESKLFANVGRYYLPVANNTNVRLAGNEYSTYNYYELEGWTSYEYGDGTYYDPILGDEIGSQVVLSDGSVADTRSVVDATIDPMYQDEFILGYQSMGILLDEEISYGVKFTYRSLNGAIDDMIIDHAIIDKFGCDASYEANQYVLGNPGKSMTVYTDTDCDGEVDDWATFTKEELEYPEAIRKYLAWDFTIGRQWDGDWSLQATYTWSHSYGNTEGLVKSDNGQDDAGLTQDFDFPELMDGAYGNLPNDRRHNLKVFGAYAISDQLLVGFNYSLASGRPINYFGTSHPDVYGEELSYGDTFYEAINTGEYDDDGALIYEYIRHARGSMGTTPWISRLDLNMTYNMDIKDIATTFKVDVFNVFNSAKATRVDETAESSIGVADPDYGLATAFQTPRYVQLSASFEY